MLAAADHAERIGLPFNRHWTVHYQLAGIAENNATRFIGHLLKLVGDYARRNNGKISAMWARENGEGKGGHVHILLHLPSYLSLVGRTRKWIGLAGGKCRARVSYTRAIGGHLKMAEMGGAHYRHNAAQVLAYLLKGAVYPTGEALGLEVFGQTGLIVGKRCGFTQNIGKAARLKSHKLR